MKRKDFLKKTITTGAAAAIVPAVATANTSKKEESTYNKLMNQVGFNHLPNKEEKVMNAVIHRANTRGHANHGWLDTHHTFSFANYHNPDRMHFGVLRVLNDDQVAPGRGFGTHPHDNMEIISIPLEGDLEHKDSMNNVAVIKQGDIQVMSAGTGIFHSEYNRNEDQQVRFLQIWLFPNKKNVTPRYDQITLENKDIKNHFQQILSPNADDEGVWIHQNAWFHLGEFTESKPVNYQLKDTRNGVYVFVIEGEAQIGDQLLGKRDGMGVWNTTEMPITPSANSKVLLMEVPMQLS
tara:strand:- start:290 stop:1171 length:882 start_codon:yes stop_codon:yes gene_type:complete